MKPETKQKFYVKILKFIFIVLLVSFITLYIGGETGYYEYEQRRRVNLTEEKIKEFENDIKEGKDIDVNEYLEDTYTDYNNKTSRLGLFISKKISQYIRSGLEVTFETLNKIITEE